MNKRILIIAGAILIIVIAVVGFMLYMNGKNKTATQNQSVDQVDTSSNGANTGASSNVTTGSLKKVSDTTAIAPVSSFDGQAVWFFTAEGQLFKVNVNTGLKQEFILPAKLNITDGIWPVAGNDFIVVTGTGTTKAFNYYNSDLKDSPEQKFVTFPASVTSMDFLPDGKHIAYIFNKAGGPLLEIGGFDLKTFEVITALPTANLTIKVSPSGDRALLYDPSAPGNGQLYLINFTDKKVITLKTAGDNSAVWSNDGRHFVYNKASTNSVSGELWYGDSNSVNDKDLGVSSPPSKAAFDKNGNIFVASSDGSNDSIWKISPTTLTKSKIFTGSTAGIVIRATNLFLSPDAATLYFKNGDGYVYSTSAK